MRILRPVHDHRGAEPAPAVRYTCLGKSKGRQCDAGASINAVAVGEFLEHYGDQHAHGIRVVVSGAEGLDGTEEANETAQEAFPWT